MRLYLNFVLLLSKNYTTAPKMIIKNRTRNRALHESSEFCEDVFSKFTGLMFSLDKNRSLTFKFGRERIISLHMFFVFYPIDVLFLDKNKVVVDMKENFRPFAFYSSKRKAMYAIELPAGVIKKSKTEIGDKIGF